MRCAADRARSRHPTFVSLFVRKVCLPGWSHSVRFGKVSFACTRCYSCSHCNRRLSSFSLVNIITLIPFPDVLAW